MLGAIQNACILHAPEVAVGHRNDGIHALAKRPLANDGVGRVGVDIQNRPKVHMNPQPFRVPRNGLSVCIGQ